jgi:hypothetical protein
MNSENSFRTPSRISREEYINQVREADDFIRFIDDLTLQCDAPVKAFYPKKQNKKAKTNA